MNDNDAGDAGELRTVLITGGSSGIGSACVRAFAEARYRVWFTYLTGKNAAHALVEELSAYDATPFFLDQGKRASVRQLAADLPGTPQALLHCAALGSGTVSSYVSHPDEQDLALLTVNALGPMWLTEALLPQMIAASKQSKIIFVSSVGGGVTQFPRFMAADGMSKAAVAFLARQLAAALTHTTIDVFGVCPGATETPMFHASTLNELSAFQRESLTKTLPKSRMIDPDEIAQLMLFLCGEQARVLHGSVLDASLGLGVRPGLLTEWLIPEKESTQVGTDGRRMQSDQ